MPVKSSGFSWRFPRPAWLVAATTVLVLCGLFLAWWTGRVAVREIDRRGGWHHPGPTSLYSRGFHRFESDSSVEQITFRQTRLPDEFFEQCRTLRNLKVIWFEECSFGDEAFRLLSGYPSVNELVLDRSDFGDEQAAELERFPGLLGLRLTGTKITDAALPHVSGMTGLTYIGLTGTAVGDASLASLKSLPKLRTIELSGTRVTDSGVEALCSTPPPSLSYLDLRGTSISADLVERLRSRFPMWRILWP